jgi:hypothetical protein
MAHLHLSLWEFYECSPIEIHYVLKSFYDHENLKNNLDWERTRTHIYFEYLFVPSRKRKVTYNTFKRDYLKLGFDSEVENKEPIIDDEQFGIIDNYFKEIEGTK